MSRFREPQHPDFRRLNSSIDFDRRLWPQDIAGSRAHAKMLAGCTRRARATTRSSQTSRCTRASAQSRRRKTTAREDLELARCLLHPRLMVRMPLVVTGLLGMERRHPREVPHWYLATLGTDPNEQGQGLGSAVLEPVLARCDEDGVGAYLESSKERNIDFYARHGFRVTDPLRLPRGPNVWPMWREPRV